MASAMALELNLRIMKKCVQLKAATVEAQYTLTILDEIAEPCHSLGREFRCDAFVDAEVRLWNEW